MHSREVAIDSYPCLGAPNHKRTIYDLVLALQYEGPLLHQPISLVYPDKNLPLTSGRSFSAWNLPRHLSQAASS
jgi:hypothetical protein